MNKIVENINLVLQKELERTTKGSAVLYGLAEPVMLFDKDGDRTFPGIVDESGEVIDVYGGTDLNDITIYHRLNSKSYDISSVSGYGSRKECRETCDMSLLVYGKRTTNQYDLERVLRKALMASTRAYEVSVYSADFNAIQVLAQEYSGVTYFLKPDYFLFKLNYRITDTDNGCPKKQ